MGKLVRGQQERSGIEQVEEARTLVITCEQTIVVDLGKSFEIKDSFTVSMLNMKRLETDTKLSS